MKIAVIAVHGVADQQPHETVNTVANLLLHMGPDGAPPRYRDFKTHELRIPHRKVRLVQPAPAVPGDDSENCQHQFLRGQLEKYEEPDPAATYQTIRTEGIRRGDAPDSEREVHIYEMYWADLSRLGNSFLTFFVELYQLLFHLSTVGAKTARFAAAQHPKMWSWFGFSGVIRLASHLLRLPVPIGNLFVLALVALAAAEQVDVSMPGLRAVIIAVPCVVLGIVVGVILRKAVSPRLWPSMLIVVMLVVGSAWLGLSRINKDCLCRLLYFEVWALLLMLLWMLLAAYEQRHPHAKKWGALLTLVASALLACRLWGSVDIIDACLWSSDILLKGIGPLWGVIILAAFLAWVFGLFAVWKTDTRSKSAAHRAVFTANLTTCLTGMLMLVINIALWGLVAQGARLGNRSGTYHTFSNISQLVDEHLQTVTILPGMATLLALMALLTLWAVWSIIPAVRAEMKTPRPDPRSSSWIGHSLTTAFRAMTLSGYLAIACFSILLLAIILFKPLHFQNSYLTEDHHKGIKLFQTFSWLILLFIIAPFFLKGFLVKLSAGFRQALDVALDVINYLRENPRDRTIRAQIFARYVSLLRYVCNWKSPLDGQGYDRIVIFAHSQGTIITVDLLRFLKVEPDPDLQLLATPDRIRLFTMGCPLRQLYGLRFPHIYDWARHNDTPAPAKGLLANRAPDPARLLSVGLWVNAYRSGDYVGRYLWRSEYDKDDDVYDPDIKLEDEAKTRREFCIGGGAHTHYWDKTTTEIVEELDRLIAL